MITHTQLQSDELPTFLRDIIQRGHSIGRSGKVIKLESFSTLNNLVVIRRLLMDMKPTRTLEVGFALGGSCLLFTHSHRDLGRRPDGQHIAIDPYQRSSWIDEAGLLEVEKAGLSGYLDFREDCSRVILPPLAGQGHRIDLAYVDGSHLFEDVFIDFYYISLLLEKDGTMLFDDCANGHVQKVCKSIRTNMTATFKEIDLSMFRPPSDRFRYRLARAIKKVQLAAFRRCGEPLRPWNSPFARF
jgi:Methyltransferase domain